MRFTKFSIAFVVIASSLGVSLFSTEARAGSEIYSTLSNCSTVNCSSIVFDGVANRNNFNQAVPFTIPVYSSGNECMRLDVTRQISDLKAVLISPSGKVWIDDDGGGNNRPLIKANTDVAGWYTLQLNYYNGGGPLASNFTLAYGLYNTGNLNCSSPTTPLNTSSARSIK
ncbi:hypothetical protein [Nostoc commune]|uniref:hypothetical protein n=1 Tax=Nostoc commune TaxID=1178 RepID=UPI0018C451AC|nr:hypothetical protein [Nostoc commune]MBG1263836.1 hypothetical protein [Nostoc commune BAE]